MKSLTVFTVLAAMVLGGCSIILPSHANLIDQAAGNAVAMSAAVQNDPNLPAAVKQWFAADEEQWRNLSCWAHGRRAAP